MDAIVTQEGGERPFPVYLCSSPCSHSGGRRVIPPVCIYPHLLLQAPSTRRWRRGATWRWASRPLLRCMHAACMVPSAGGGRGEQAAAVRLQFLAVLPAAKGSNRL